MGGPILASDVKYLKKLIYANHHLHFLPKYKNKTSLIVTTWLLATLEIHLLVNAANNCAAYHLSPSKHFPICETYTSGKRTSYPKEQIGPQGEFTPLK